MGRLRRLVRWSVSNPQKLTLGPVPTGRRVGDRPAVRLRNQPMPTTQRRERFESWRKSQSNEEESSKTMGSIFPPKAKRCKQLGRGRPGRLGSTVAPHKDTQQTAQKCHRPDSQQNEAAQRDPHQGDNCRQVAYRHAVNLPPTPLFDR